MRSNTTAVLKVIAVLCLLPSILRAQDLEPRKGLIDLSKDEYETFPIFRSEVTGGTPRRVTLEWKLPIPGNQGDWLSCTAWATSYNKAYRIYEASGERGSPDDYLQSPAFIFSNLTQDRCDKGTKIARALQFLTLTGSVDWRTMPYSDRACREWENVKSRADHQSTDSHRLDSEKGAVSISEIKNLLAGGDPIIASIDACDDFSHPRSGMVSEYSGANDPSCGAHAVLIVGYDEDLKAVRVLNSWGTKENHLPQRLWTNDGKVWMSYGVFTRRFNFGFVDDGPTLNAAGFNFLPQGDDTSPSSATSAVPAVTPEVLLQGLRVSVDSEVIRQFVDNEGPETVSNWSVWLNVPKAYQQQIKRVRYQFEHKTFPKNGWLSKRGSSIFQMDWGGYGCVDKAIVTAELKGSGPPVSASYNLCQLIEKQVPRNLWPPAH